MDHPFRTGAPSISQLAIEDGSLLSGRYWATLAVEPQLVAFKGASPSHNLDLSQNERLQARLLFGFQL